MRNAECGMRLQHRLERARDLRGAALVGAPPPNFAVPARASCSVIGVLRILSASHTCIHACISYMHICIHALMHTSCIQTYMHTCMHEYMLTSLRAYTTCTFMYDGRLAFCLASRGTPPILLLTSVQTDQGQSCFWRPPNFSLLRHALR